MRHTKGSALEKNWVNECLTDCPPQIDRLRTRCLMASLTRKGRREIETGSCFGVRAVHVLLAAVGALVVGIVALVVGIAGVVVTVLSSH